MTPPQPSDDEFHLSVAAEIRATMARRQIKQNALAAALGMSQPALSRRLTGELPFDLIELGRVVRLLGDTPLKVIERAQNLKKHNVIDRHLALVSDIQGQISMDDMMADLLPPPVLQLVPSLPE